MVSLDRWGQCREKKRFVYSVTTPLVESDELLYVALSAAENMIAEPVRQEYVRLIIVQFAPMAALMEELPRRLQIRFFLRIFFTPPL